MNIYKDIDDIEKINNTQEVWGFTDGTQKVVEVVPITTRLVAEILAYSLTKEFLKKDNAIDFVNIMTTDFELFTNSELEDYIINFSDGIRYRIKEKCSYQGWSWFDHKY